MAERFGFLTRGRGEFDCETAVRPKIQGIQINGINPRKIKILHHIKNNIFSALSQYESIRDA
jgi:hypothetical protein